MSKGMSTKSVSLDSGKNIDTPTKADASIHAFTKKIKSSVESETGTTYSTFTALEYMKIDGNYFVKIKVGGSDCVHVKFRIEGISPKVQDIEEDKSTSDELTEF